MRKSLSIAAGLVISAIFLFFALRQVDLKNILQIYGHLQAWEIAVFAAVLITEFAIRGFRWYLLISACAKVKLSDVIKLELIGLALNNILPLRLGEAARAVLASKITGVPIFTCAATIVVERALDVLSLGIMFSFAAGRIDSVPWINDYKTIAWVLLILPVAGLFALVFLDNFLAKITALSKFPRLEKFVRQVALGAEALRKPKLALIIIASGLAIWMMDGFGYFWSGKILSLNPSPSYITAILILSVAALAVSMPAMPGYFGSFEFAVQQILFALGIDRSTALAYAAFMHVTAYTITTALGVFFLYQMGHSLGGLWKSLKK
ncbi:MAG: lysylphosphatidylglycerol synthase transmembrane domain-containing protein [Elusimicrobia bacterium]|nr:lysylphosphatidylglycerol synthase transmembrane domain-containing protein [Elusimicrobiota bacterium]